MSYKSLIAWKWINSNCNLKSIRFVIKMDENVILNSYYLNQLIESQITVDVLKPLLIDQLNNTFIGSVFKGFSPDKRPASKFYIKDKEYNSKLYEIEHYSDYCFSGGFIITVDLIKKLYIYLIL